MFIIKLGEICFIKRGSSPRPISKWLKKEGLMWAKISDLNGNFLRQTKEFIDFSWEAKGLLGSYGDLFITNSATPGIPFIQLSKKVAYHDGFLSIKCNENVIIKKYLFYKLILDRPKLIKMGNGAIFINLSSEILKNWKIEVPSIKIQNQIIGIIEPIENLENKLINIKNKLIELLINLYNYSNNNQISFNSVIKILISKYENQINYFATNAVGEMQIDYKKIINLSEKIPSRANISPWKDSFIFSKLAGENKIFYFKDKPKEVFSTGFFNFKTEHHDHILGFMLSNDFKKQKEYLATGTTMQGINNSSLELIKLNKSSLKSSIMTTTLYDLENNLIKIKKLKAKLINLLLK